MKRIFSGLFLIILIFGTVIKYGECSAPVRANTYTSGSVIDPSDVTANEDAIFTYLTAGVDTLASNAVDASGEIADGVILNADVNASAAITGSKITPTFAANTSPSADDTYDLGTSSAEWKDLYIDGTANIDTASLTTVNANTTITINESGNNDVLDIVNDGTGDGLYIDHNGVIATGKHGLFVDGSAATVAADSALVKILQDSASASEPALEIQNDGTGATIEMVTKGAIKFPATAVSDTDANTIDDYEEGYYTATLTCGTGTVTVAAAFDQLAYTKIGRLVYITGEIQTSGISSPSGTLTLNIPFTATDLTESAGMSRGEILIQGGAGIFTGYPIMGISDAGTTINIADYNFAANPAAPTSDLADHIDGSTTITLSITYLVE